MNLRRYLDLFRKWLWLIALAALLAGGAAFLASRLSTPIYRASATLLVNQVGNSGVVSDYNALLASQQFAKTYTELLVKRPTLEAVIQNLGLNTTAGGLLGQIQVGSVRDTTLITINVEDSDPVRAAAIANELGRVFIAQVNDTQRNRFSSSEDNISKQMQALLGEIASTEASLAKARRSSPAQPDEVARLELALLQYQSSYSNILKSYEDLRLLQARVTDTVTIAEAAVVPDRPVRPQTLLNTLVAAIVGATVAAGVAFFIELLDDTVKSPDEIAELNVANLGLIAQIDPKVYKDRLVVVSASRSPVAEAFRALRTNIQFAAVDRDLRVLLVTSPGPSEGKSTVAANLAAALAQGGQKVALVDADLRRPTVHKLFKFTNNLGLTNALIQNGNYLNGFLRPSQIENLGVMVSGAMPPNPAELLGSDRAASLLENLKTQVDVVIVDTPPCLVVTDAVALSKRADGVLIVTQAGKTRRSALELALKTLQQVGAPVLGTVLNQYSARKHSGYYSYEYQYSSVYTEGDTAPSGVLGPVKAFLARVFGGSKKSAQRSEQAPTEAPAQPANSKTQMPAPPTAPNITTPASPAMPKMPPTAD